MNEDKISNEISTLLQEFRNLVIDYEESKKEQKRLKELVEVLREALKTARDAERNAEAKRRKNQGFVAQQQEVILKLLHIKEENEHLKQTVSHMETRMIDIQNSRTAEYDKKSAEINKIKQGYLKQLLRMQEEGDEQVKNIEVKLEMASEELRLRIVKHKEVIEKQSNTILHLRSENTDLKEKADTDLETYQNKLAEQEKEHQAELETWKVAAMNKSTYNRREINNPVSQYSRVGPYHTMQNTTSSQLPDTNEMSSEVLRFPDMSTHYEAVHDSSSVKFSDHSNSYQVNHDSITQLPKSDYQYQLIQNDSFQQSESNDYHHTQNNSVSHFSGNRNNPPIHRNNNCMSQFPESCHVNPQLQNSAVSQFPMTNNPYQCSKRMQTYPKLPLISRSHNVRTTALPRKVRPLPRPVDNEKKNNAGFKKAGELYLQSIVNKGNESKDESENCEESNELGKLEGSRVEKKLPVQNKKRKLYSSEQDSLL